MPNEESLNRAEWLSISQAEKELGISRNELMSRVHNGKIPFRKKGSRYSLNLKLTRAYLAREDIENMNYVQHQIALQPMSRKKVDMNGLGERKGGIRKVEA